MPPAAKIAKAMKSTASTHLAYNRRARGGIWASPARWWIDPSYTRSDEGDTTTLEKTLAAAKENLEAVDAAPTAEDPAECVTARAITHGRS